MYTLKLLKMQTKYLGRQWRKSNMRTVSAIYQKVRHRLVDDWAYGNGESDDQLVSINFIFVRWTRLVPFSHGEILVWDWN